MGNWTLSGRFWLKISALLFVLTTLKASRRLAQQPLGDLHISQSSGRVLTSLSIAGSDPVPVVFDTGTSGNILDRKLAAKLGFPNLGPSTAIDGSLGKPVAGFLTEVKGASLGNLAIDAGQGNAIDYDLPNEKGIFGPNSFRGKLVQMDLGNGSILVKPKTAATLPPGAGITSLRQNVSPPRHVFLSIVIIMKQENGSSFLNRLRSLPAFAPRPTLSAGLSFDHCP
ncbi:MAG: aspartyl protease family protein [Limisphaerales bacterium]